MDLPVEEKTISSSIATGCKALQSPNAKTEPKQLKRKLFSQTGGSADEEENKKGSTPKRRKSVHSDAGSPPALTPGNTASRTPGGGRLSVPLSERQQMALIMQQYANAEPTSQGDTSPRPPSPQSAGKKTPLDKKIHKKNEKGETLLHIAAIKGDTKQCKKLIKAGADVNVRDNAGWTPLHEACNHGYFAIAKQLLKNGANVNVQGCDNDTPLHDASGNGHVKLVEMLLRHGANPLQSNTRGKAPIDIAANDTILKLLKSETIASSSSGDSITSEIRSPTSPESMSEDDDPKTKKGSEAFFSPNPRASSTHLPAYSQQGATSHTSAHSPTSTSRLSSPPKVDPYDFSDNDTSNPSTHLSATPQRLTLKLMKKEKREERDNVHSPKRGGLSSSLHGSYHSSTHEDAPPSKRFKSFASRLEENSNKYTPSAASKFDKQSVLDRLSPASFSSQDSDLVDPKLDISAFSSGPRDNTRTSRGNSPLTFASVSKVSSSDSILSGHRTALSDSKHKTVSRYGKEPDTSTQPDSQMPKLSQESGTFSPDSGDDSDENPLQIDIDSTVPSKPNMRESVPSNKQLQSHHVGGTSGSPFQSALHGHNKSDVSSSNSDSSKSRFSSLSRRSPSPFRFTDSPTSSISPGQSLYSNKDRNLDKFKDTSSVSTLSFGFGSRNKSEKFDGHSKNDKSKHGKDIPASSANSHQSQPLADTLIKKEPVDLFSEVSQYSVKSTGSGKSHVADSGRNSVKTEKDNSALFKPGDTKISSKLVPKQEPKEESSPNRHSPVSSAGVKLESKELATVKIEKDKAIKQEPCDTRSPKQEKDSGGKTSPKTAQDTNRFSPKPHAKDTGTKPNAAQPSPLMQHKWDSNRASPKPDRGDRDSPKSDKSDKSDNLKVPPLKIIMPAKATPSDHRHVPSTKATTSARGGNLPYVINPTQDGAAEGVVGSSGVAADGAPPPPVTSLLKQSRSSSRASSVASGGGEKEQESFDLKGDDSNHCVSSTQQEGSAPKRARRLEREGARTEDEESRDGSSKGDRTERSGGEAEKADDTSERRVTRSQVRSLKGHSVDLKEAKETAKEDITGKDGSGSEKDKLDATSGDKDGAGSTKGSNHGNQKEDEPIHIHPRKRKLRQRQQQENNSTVDLTQFNLFPRIQHQDKTSNPYEMFLDIRKKVAKRRLDMAVITPKAPQGFKDYLMVNCNYVLQGNAASKLAIPLLSPPTGLEGPMKELFTEQEKSRYKLRLQHHIEREKLMLSIEQEIVRVHGRAARALANQSTPLSVCAVLRDEEIYNPISDDKDKSGARQRYNGRQFLGWLQDVDDKYEKIKESLLMRHHHEAESLNAVQKLEWEWKLRDNMLWDQKSNPSVSEAHVPMVQVNDEFELLPS